MVEGIDDPSKVNGLALRRTMDTDANFYVKVTRNNTLLAFPRATEDREKLLKKKAGKISFRPTRPRQALGNTSNFSIVMLGVSTDVTNDEMTKELGSAAVRLIAAKTGTPTTKVRVALSTQVDKNAAIKNGMVLGHMHHKCVEYLIHRPPTQCYKCQQFGHTSRECNNPDVCRKCSGDHRSAECNAAEKRCANCNGNHPASYKGCKIMSEASTKEDTTKITDAQRMTKGNALDAVRIALCVSRSFNIILSSNNFNPNWVTKVVTAEANNAFRTNLDTEVINSAQTYSNINVKA